MCIIKNILFDFLENRKYNYEKRAAGKRKTSFPAARFRLLKYSIAIKKCVACQRKSSLYARSTLFYMYSRSLLTKSSTKRFREYIMAKKGGVKTKWQKVIR